MYTLIKKIRTVISTEKNPSIISIFTYSIYLVYKGSQHQKISLTTKKGSKYREEKPMWFKLELKAPGFVLCEPVALSLHTQLGI